MFHGDAPPDFFFFLSFLGTIRERPLKYRGGQRPGLYGMLRRQFRGCIELSAGEFLGYAEMGRIVRRAGITIYED